MTDEGLILTGKRKRVPRVYNQENDESFRQALGIRKKKKAIDTTIQEPIQYVKPKKPLNLDRSNMADEIAKSESIRDMSLAIHFDQLRSFISPKVALRLQSLRQSVSTEDALSSEKIRPVEQPSSLNNVQMRQYQIAGLSWLVDRYDKCINCILADEMGLGKTLQTIAFFAYLRDTRMLPGPYLVVVPLSVMFNWVAEFKRFCPSLRLHKLHSNRSSDMPGIRSDLSAVSSYDVCLTTYETVKGSMQTSLTRILWRGIVLDEGHRIKNDLTNISHACSLLHARFKLILTGTPVQNNLRETYCLLNFLLPTIFDTDEPFTGCFDTGQSKIHVDRDSCDRAHYLMRPFILRRIKSEVEQTLPIKLETMIRCPLSEMQKFWIRGLLLQEEDVLRRMDMVASQPSAGVDGSNNKGVSTADWKRLQGLLAQLRKAANHPYLFEGAENEESLESGPTEEIVHASGKMKILDQLLPMLQRNGHRVVLFSQFTRTLDIISDYLEWRGYNACRFDGSTNRVMRAVLINNFNRPKSDVFIFCLSTRAGGEGVNLFTADTVILFDSDWNPQVDMQAMARVHRIGQTKPVHVYRLIAGGSVEERIVQRAQKKLFLDTMVNRGCTSRALEIDSLRNKSEAIITDDNVDMSTTISALRFGWDSCFGAAEAVAELTKEDLGVIIDRTRGLNNESGNGIVYDRNKGFHAVTKPVSKKLLENQQVSVEDFDENLPMVGLRNFDNKHYARASVTQLGDISMQWALEKKREVKSRLNSVHVKSVGLVNVLKVNEYSLENGEPSVFEREASGYKSKSSSAKKQRNQFENQGECMSCWDGGKLICCDRCPAAYHLRCVGLRSLPKSMWLCPHHSCCTACGKTASVCSMLFRCAVCPEAVCEDCLDPDFEFLGEHPRWGELGYKKPSTSCFVYCSADCIRFSERLSKGLLGDDEGEGGEGTGGSGEYEGTTTTPSNSSAGRAVRSGSGRPDDSDSPSSGPVVTPVTDMLTDMQSGEEVQRVTSSSGNEFQVGDRVWFKRSVGGFTEEGQIVKLVHAVPSHLARVRYADKQYSNEKYDEVHPVDHLVLLA